MTKREGGGGDPTRIKKKRGTGFFATKARIQYKAIEPQRGKGRGIKRSAPTLKKTEMQPRFGPVRGGYLPKRKRKPASGFALPKGDRRRPPWRGGPRRPCRGEAEAPSSCSRGGKKKGGLLLGCTTKDQRCLDAIHGKRRGEKTKHVPRGGERTGLQQKVGWVLEKGNLRK